MRIRSLLHRLACFAGFAFLIAPMGARALDIIKTNNLDALNLGTSWVGGTAPAAADTAVFDSTFAGPGLLDTAALVQWAGLRVTNPGTNVSINNATTGNNVGIGAGGIDLSAATTNLVVRRYQMNASQTWDIAAGRSFRIGAPGATFAPAANNAAVNRVGVFVNNSAGATITKNGAGIVYLDMGNVSLGNVNWQVSAGTLAAIWNQAAAFGSGTITLAGGGLADGTPIAGSLGNWTWTNSITLQAATSSFIDNQNTGGSGRWLKLESPIGGSGNLEFRDTGVGFDNLNNGFILAGDNTMSGTVTITAAAEVRVGGSAPGGLNANPGAFGTLGTATIVNNGWLTLARTDTWSTTNNLSGAGAVRVGSESLAGTDAQSVTVSGAWTHTGNTLINRGTLAFSAGSSLPNTAEIFLNAPNVESTTLDVSAIAPYTLGSGRKLIGRGTTGANIVSGNFVAAGGSTLVPGGSNAVNILTFNNDLGLGGGTLLMDVGSANWDRIQVNGNFSPSGVTTIQFVPSGALTTGEYPLIQVSGTLGGSTNNFAITGLSSSGSRQTFSLAYNTPSNPNAVVLVVGGSAPANLTWVGDGAANIWNLAGATNWTDGVNPEQFFINDSVTFDDSGSTNPAVNLVGSLLPAAVTINGTVDYTFTGTGGINGAATLSKTSTGTLTLANTNAYTGVTTVSAGTLAVSSGAAIADAGSVNVDAAGAVIQVNASETVATLNNVAGSTVNVASGTLNYTNGSILGTLSGSGTLVRNGTADTVFGQFTSADALAFTGTLRLRGSTPSLNPGSMQAATGRFWLHDTNGTQLVGTKFHLDTGSSISNAQDLIVGDWDAVSGNRKLTLASLTGYGSLRSDAGTAGDRRIIVDQAVDTTFNGMILAHGSTHTPPFVRNVYFEKQGAGTLTMANVMGRQTASAGVSNATLTIQVSGGKLVLTATNTIDGSIAVAGGATLEVGGAGLLGNGTYAYAITNNGTLTLGSSANQTLTGGISGTGTLTKIGNGTLTLAGANTYTGATTVNGGSLVGVTGGSLSSVVTVAAGATNGVQVASNGGQWICAGLIYSGAGSTADFNFGVSTPSASAAPIQVNGNLDFTGAPGMKVRGGVFTVGSYPLYKYTGALSGTPPVAAAALPAGVVATISNNVPNKSIDLVVTVGNVLTWAVGDGPWDIDVNANWKDTGGASLTYTNDRPVKFDDSASGTSPITVALNTNVTTIALVADNLAKDYVISGTGSVGGGAGLIKQGAGRLTVSTPNTYTGGTVVNAGVVNVQNATALGAGSVTVASGAALELQGGISLSSVPLTLSGTGTGTAGALRNVNGTNAYGSAVTLAANSTIGVDANQLTISGVVSGANNLTKTGAGLLALSATSTYTGGTVINNGTLALTGGGGASGTVRGTVTVNGGTTLRLQSSDNLGYGTNGAQVVTLNIVGGTLDSAGGNNQTTVADIVMTGGSIIGVTNLDLFSLTPADNNASVTTLASAGTATISVSTMNLRQDAVTFSVADGAAATDLLVSSVVGNGSGGLHDLVKTGAGKMVMTGANTYSGLTSVSNGTLVISSAHLGAGGFDVADGATLGVDNTAATSAQMSTLTLGSSGTATLQFANVSSITVPLLSATGGITVNGANTINIADANSLVAGNTYPLAAYGAGLTGGLPALTVPSGVTATLTNDTVNSWIALIVTSVGPTYATNPTNLTFSVSGGTLNLSWPADHLGWILQSQTNSRSLGLSNNWTDIPGSSTVTNMAITVNPADPTVFYRLRIP